MITEAISITLNLGCFTSLIWSMFIFKNANTITKIKALLLFLCFSLFFYFFFSIIFKFNEIKFFEIKEIYFSHTFVYIFICSILFIFFLVDKKYVLFVTISCFFLSPYVYFLIFGIEKYLIFDFEIRSLSLLKAQNPLIFISCLFIYFLRWFKVQFILFFLILIILNYSIHTRKITLSTREKETVYSMYVPYEYFFSNDLKISELKKGLYTIKSGESSDKLLFRFSLWNIKNLKREHRQKIQFFISVMNFPVLIDKDSEILMYDLARSYNKNMLKLIYNKKKDKIKVTGPLF